MGRPLTQPNTESIKMMLIIDNLAPPWRALIYEYGFKSVCDAINSGTSLEDAADALWMARSARQAQWMATDYVTKRSAASWNA